MRWMPTERVCMKIAAIKAFVVCMPLVISGWGKGFGHRAWPATRTALDRMVAPLCIGRDPREINALMGDLARALRGAGRNGPVLYALSAIDIALWDIAGKLAVLQRLAVNE